MKFGGVTLQQQERSSPRRAFHFIIQRYLLLQHGTKGGWGFFIIHGGSIASAAAQLFDQPGRLSATSPVLKAPPLIVASFPRSSPVARQLLLSPSQGPRSPSSSLHHHRRAATVELVFGCWKLVSVKFNGVDDGERDEPDERQKMEYDQDERSMNNECSGRAVKREQSGRARRVGHVWERQEVLVLRGTLDRANLGWQLM
ncbi:hypothetical protein LR48_Vigan01g103000 [Vigna angularis]|uniref:Uncharacterized protein n=1 Tax=Phaseolus angularis TaxID=3914 RepID=A0A0L9TLR0_PHAAN|nr:hypothetical protein LR48_Vigan01g103000 [Vigna angularis]